MLLVDTLFIEVTSNTAMDFVQDLEAFSLDHLQLLYILHLLEGRRHGLALRHQPQGLLPHLQARSLLPEEAISALGPGHEDRVFIAQRSEASPNHVFRASRCLPQHHLLHVPPEAAVLRAQPLAQPLGLQACQAGPAPALRRREGGAEALTSTCSPERHRRALLPARRAAEDGGEQGQRRERGEASEKLGPPLLASPQRRP
mmetsp:Transcript_22032/g.44527  ORF Transcript_22032/g.44527 Transcript_22032/m.44527 type:complete len:201 (+) Transcript_22032:199-801(+)